MAYSEPVLINNIIELLDYSFHLNGSQLRILSPKFYISVAGMGEDGFYLTDLTRIDEYPIIVSKLDADYGDNPVMVVMLYEKLPNDIMEDFFQGCLDPNIIARGQEMIEQLGWIEQEENVEEAENIAPLEMGVIHGIGNGEVIHGGIEAEIGNEQEGNRQIELRRSSRKRVAAGCRFCPY